MPAVWLLGSSGYSAQLAGLLGFPFAFSTTSAPQIRCPHWLCTAGRSRRRPFWPSPSLDQRFGRVRAGWPTAQWLHGSSRLSMLRLRTGHPSTLPTPEEAAEYPYNDAERAVVAEATASHVVGDPAAVVASLRQLAERTGVDELMVTTSTYAHADRLESYRLLAEAAALEPLEEEVTAPRR